MLQLLARYDRPVARLAIARALPWLANNQNKDGSWRKESVKDSSTFPVLSALISLRDDLPSGLLRWNSATERRTAH